MSLPLDFHELSLSTMRDPDLNHLVSQNQTLAAELSQCQADKEFVWSLWKKLQVSNPDVTEAISLVIQREKEKCENKDRKVLEIIQVKDDRIEELQNIMAKQAQEISDGLSKKVELTEKNSRIQLENDRLQEKVHALDLQVRGEANRERSLEDNFRRTVEGTEKEKYELNRSVSRLTSDLEVAKSEKAYAVNRQKILEERIRTLENEVSDKMEKFEDLVKEVEDSTSRLSRYESQTVQQRRELDFKNQELENIRKELRELWTTHNQLTEHSGQQADLIRQLQSLQQDTQKMMKNQEDAFSLESSSQQQMFTDVNTRYEISKRTEAELRQQVLELKKSLMEKDDIISSLQSQDGEQRSSSARQSTSQAEYSGSFLDIVQEVDAIHPVAAPGGRRARARGSSLNRNIGHGSPRDESQVYRSRSLSPPTKDTEGRTASFYAHKLTELKKAVELKTLQVDELKRAHNNRLQRLQSLQSSYRLAREEIKTYEFGSKAKARKPKRANPRSLQKEDSDEVWNELAYFKAQNRSLQVDKISLQEEVDLLRVQTSQDAASIHELKVSSETEKEEFQFQLARQKRETRGAVETENQLSVLKVQVQNKAIHIERLERDLSNIVSQKDDLVQEKSKLMSQLVSTQQEASRYRMDLADVKHQLQSTRHELEEMRHSPQDGSPEEVEMATPNKSEVVSAVAARLKSARKKKAKKSVGQYREHMAAVLDGLNEDGWEEIPDSNDGDSESESPSLGENIARNSSTKASWISNNSMDKSKRKTKPRRTPTNRPPTQSNAATNGQDNVPRLKSPRRSSSPNDKVRLREFATSPISFLAATSPSLEAPSTAQPEMRNTPTTVIRPVRRTLADSRQLASLRQRVSHLQQQVAVLKKVKMSAIQKEDEQKEIVRKLQADLTSANGRLKAAKQHVQKLQTDLECVHKEKQEMELATATQKTEGKAETGGDNQEVKVLEAKLKVATSEVTRQSATLRMMKTDNEGLQEIVRNLQDRVNHLERDVNQKRNLLESQRIKLKHAQDLSKTDANNVEELQTKLKLLTENNNKFKVQVDSLKKRMSLVTKDKKEYEDKFLKVSLDLEHKKKQLHEAFTCRSGLESALANLEASAQQQLHGLATQSEAAIDTAKDKLTIAQTRIAQFQSMIKILAAELVTRTDRARAKVKEARASQERSQREGDASLQRAQDRARDILNLSHSDLEDIMSADGDGLSQESVPSHERKSDKQWLRKCEKLMNSKEDFVHPLTSLLLQKTDERADLLLKMSMKV